MSGVNLDAIYQRLQSIPRYHPMSANTFADWAMEAGDIVTVKRDGTGYASPVGTMTLKWNGKQQIQISTEGSRERDSISKVSARKYARGAGGSSGIRSDRELYWEMSSEDGLVHASIHATEEYLRTDYSKKISDQNIELRGVVTQTAESLTSDYTKKIGDTNTTLRGVIQQTAASLTSDYTRMIGEEDVAMRSHVKQTADQINTSIENLETGLSTKINETDSTVSLAVGKVKYSSVQNYANKTSFPTTGTAGVLYHANDTGIDYLYMPGTHSYEKAETDEYGNANFIKAGEIAITINESGDPEAKLDAKVVYAGANTKQTLAGLELPDWMDTTEGLIAEKATIVSLNALKARVGTLETDYLKTARLSSAFTNLGSASISELTADTMYIKPISGMGAVSVANAFTNAKITQDGNTYKLQALRFNSTSWEDIGTFSRATSLSGAWSGGELTVTASPQGATLKAIIDSVIGNGTVTYADSLLNVPIKVMGKIGSGSQTETGYTQDFKVSPTAAFNAQSMSGSWSNGTATLSVSPGSASGTAKIDSVLANGAVTYDSENKILKVPLRVMGKIGNGSLTDTGYTQDFSVLAGDAYNAGWDAVGKPSVTFTGLDTQGTPTLGGVSGSASISNKTDGSSRSTNISLSLDKTTYTPSQAAGAKNCVVVKTSGGTVVGRIDTQSVYDDGHSDGYDAGWNAISSPSVTFTGLDGTTLGGVSGKATISNKTDGTGRSTSFSLSMEKTTYTPSASVGAKDCVVVKTSGGTVVGRIDTGGSYNSGYVAGWNAARNKVSRSGDTVYKPKARSGTDITTDVGTEAAYTATLNKGSAWGKAKLYRREKTSAGTGSWYVAEGYDTADSVTSGNTTYYFKAAGGYWGWDTEPSISWS